MKFTMPRKGEGRARQIGALLGGFGAGIALLYFFASEQGKRRRSLLRDQFTESIRVSRETAEATANDLRSRTIGAMHEARKAVAGVAGGESSDTDISTYDAAGVPTEGARYPTPGGHEAGLDEIDAFLKSLETGTAQTARVEGKKSDLT